MKIREIINEQEMTENEAIMVFSRLGYDPRDLDSPALKNAYYKLMKKYHPDNSGDTKLSQMINVAYDILSKKKPQTDDRSGVNQANQQKYNDIPPWAWAGYSGGLPDRGHIYREDYTDPNYIKKTMWELSSQSKTEYTLWGFDGHYFRNVLSVYGSPKIFNEMAKAMIDWQTKGGNPYQCRAVFVSPGKSKTMYVIYADGKFYGDHPINVEYNSFNANPGNDQAFTRRLPEFLDNLDKPKQIPNEPKPRGIMTRLLKRSKGI